MIFKKNVINFKSCLCARGIRPSLPSQVDCRHLWRNFSVYDSADSSPSPSKPLLENSSAKSYLVQITFQFVSFSEENLATNFSSVCNLHAKHVCTNYLSAKMPRIWRCQTGLGSSLAVLDRIALIFSRTKKTRIGPNKYHDIYRMYFLYKYLLFVKLQKKLGINLHYVFCMCQLLHCRSRANSYSKHSDRL